MPIMLSPGVHVRELDFSDYVAQASTCVFGIVGGAVKGPLEPTLITSQADFIKIFGKPTLNDFGAHSALAVLANADQIYYKRTYHRAVKATSAKNKLQFTAALAGETLNGTDITDTEVQATPDTYTVVVTPPTGTAETYTVTLADPLDAKYITRVINGVSKYVTASVELTGVISASYELAGGDNGAAFGTTPESDLMFTTRNYDSTLNEASIVLSKKDDFGFFNYELKLGDTVLEAYQSLSDDPTDERFLETFINTHSLYITCSFDETTTGDITGVTYDISGGSDGIEGLTTSEVISDLQEAFDNTEVIDVDIILTPGWTDRVVINAGIVLAETRADCLYIFDPPYGLKAQQVVDWANATGVYATEAAAFNSSYAAVYWPWVQVNDIYSNQKIWLPPSGYVGAQIAYSDSVSEPWFAPAGLNRGRLTKPIAIEYSPNKGERDLLYGNQNVINPIVNFKGQGLTIWGQKTTQRRYTALNRVNVRRLLNFLKKVIAASTVYFVFEPNDEYSWERWYEMVEPKLAGVKAKRGVYEFLINMAPTTDEIDNNMMPGQIKIKPTKTAEFIPLDFMIMPTGASFEEK